jgi:hypothetical protein
MALLLPLSSLSVLSLGQLPWGYSNDVIGSFMCIWRLCARVELLQAGAVPSLASLITLYAYYGAPTMP